MDRGLPWQRKRQKSHEEEWVGGSAQPTVLALRMQDQEPAHEEKPLEAGDSGDQQGDQDLGPQPQTACVSTETLCPLQPPAP